MSGVSPVMTGGPVPLSAASTMPLKRGDEDDYGPRSLRPTLSFRQKPEPPKLPPQLSGDDAEKGLRATLSFRQKPEPPKGVSFLEQPKQTGEKMDAEKQRQMQKTKSKIDMLQNLIREGSSAGQPPRADPDESDDSSDDEPAAPMPHGTGGRALIRPSAPPPPPPGLSAVSDLPPLPKASIKPPPPPPHASTKPAPPPKAISPPPGSDDNAADNWVTMWSPEKNRNYFYNKKTGASTWEDPSLLQGGGGGQTSPTAQQQPPTSSKAPRANGLEKAIHKKTLEKPTDDEVDVFGRPSGDAHAGDVHDSRGSSGSSAGRMSLRKTLSRALGLTSGAKKTSSLRMGSDSGSDSHKPPKPGSNSHPTVTVPPASQTTIPPEPSPIFGDNGGRGSMRSFGSMKSMSSAVSHESESRSVERPIHDKHVEVVAEVRTKAGRHTIVRSKKPKKKDHSMVIEEVNPAPSTPGVFIAPLQSPLAAAGNPMFQPPSPLGQPPVHGVVPPVITPNQFQHVQQQQGLVRAASSPHMIAGRPAYGGAPVVQHFGAPHPQHMGPGFIQPQPFAAYASAPASTHFMQQQPPQVFQSYGRGVPSPQPYGQAPPPVPQPRVPVRYVQALYDFRPSNPANVSEMPLKRGEMIQLVEQGADGWWEGIHCVTGQRGLFPGSHVQFVQ